MLLARQQHLRRTCNKVTPARGRALLPPSTIFFFFFFNLFSLKSSLLYLHGWNLEVSLPVQAVRHLEGGGTIHFPHAFQGDHVQLELGYQIKACER